MDDIVMCALIRTPVGRYGGAYASLSALGQCYPNGEAPAIGRVAALDAVFERVAP